MQTLYPLAFHTIFKDKIWGGEKIRSILHKDFAPLPNCGETWEISGVKGNESVVKNGPLAGHSLPELIGRFGGQLVGQRVYERFGSEFPLLLKFIDANDDLSVQVHPNDELARKRHNSFGKTEMWYIIQADEGASLISGFNRPLDRDTYLHYFEQNRLFDILNREPAHAGDVFFLPAGRVHTIGKGLLLAEIQQTSDITYRIYDFDRTDAQGNKRELHLEQALDAIDYTYYESYKTLYEPRVDAPVELVSCPYFTTNRLHARHTMVRNYAGLDSFVVYMCLQGGFELAWQGGSMPVRLGDSILLPASIEQVELRPQGEFNALEAYVP